MPPVSLEGGATVWVPAANYTYNFTTGTLTLDTETETVTFMKGKEGEFVEAGRRYGLVCKYCFAVTVLGPRRQCCYESSGYQSIHHSFIVRYL